MIRLRLTEITKDGRPAWRITIPQPDGGRKFKTYAKEDEANAAFELLEIEQRNHGISLLNITPELRHDAVGAAKILERFFGVTLVQAAQYYADHHRSVAESQTVENAVSTLLNSKSKKKPRYRKDLKNRLERFKRAFGSRKISDIQRPEILAWLSSLGVGPLTENTFRLRLSALWSFAKLQGWVGENIIEEIPKQIEEDGKIGILKPEQMAKLLEVASAETLPYWVVGGFCGLRSAELERLEWSDFHWQAKPPLVEVKASKAKTASRRLIPLRPNALRWLKPYRKNTTGPICPRNLRNRLDQDREAAGIAEWPNNALRHSFASYLLAHTKNANEVAHDMGHKDADLLYSTYRELVLPQEARKYWRLVPVTRTGQKKVIPMAA